jgi:heptosyltransferase-3
MNAAAIKVCHMESIIIFRIGSLGDTVVALPCFHKIARSFPNSRRIVVTDVPASKKASSVESILGKSGLIDGTICFPPPPRKIHDIRKLRTQVRATRAKTLVYLADRDLPRTLRDLCFFRWCGIRRVIGAPLTRDLRVPHIDPATGFTESESARLARCLAPLGTIDLNDRAFWDLGLQPAEIDSGDRYLAPLKGRSFITVNVGGKVGHKDWGNDNWSFLFRLMAVRHSALALVFVGSADEFDRSAELAALWPGPTLNLCGRLGPRGSAAAMKRAVLFVGHDSGPIHLAAAVGVRCVGMFGNFNMPKWWHPAGEQHHIIHDMRGVRMNSPQDVYAAIDLTLAEASICASGSNLDEFLEESSVATKRRARQI